MAKFIKHVGKHGDRKVAVVFRQIPGEEHMCLVVYTETLNQNIHDPLMTCIESDAGQTSENLGDALNRGYTRDGKILLQVLHREGMLKKIQANQVVMTPVPNQSIRLSELNDMLNEMAKGEEAVKKLAEMDSSRGLQDPKDVARRVQENIAQQSQPMPQGLLDNSVLATNLRQQAERMSNEAKGLMAEAQRLLKEAAQMEGVVEEAAPVSVSKITKMAKASTEGAKNTTKTSTKKTATVKIVDTTPVKKTRAKKVANAS